VDRTPGLSAAANQVSLRTEVTINDDGVETGRTETNATGPAATALRENAVELAIEGPGEAATRILRTNGMPGQGAFSFPDPYLHAPSFRIAADFTSGQPQLSRTAAWLPIPAGLPRFTRHGGLFIGMRGGAPGPVCYAGHQTEDVRLTLPAWAHVTALPPAVRVTGGPLSYQSSYRLQGGVVVAHRELVMDVSRPLCTEAEYHALLPVLSAIRQDLDAGVMLAPERPRPVMPVAHGGSAGHTG
jgi:hypothetical protein